MKSVCIKRYEIGSFFPLMDYEQTFKKCVDEAEWLPSNGDTAYTISGRAAIELAIKDILNTNERINSVYMPSYCCDSMQHPFIKNNIRIIYYNVNFNSEKGIVYNIDTSTNCDIFFAMSYFGIDEPNKLDNAINFFSQKGVKIIEDITHRLLYEVPYNSHVHYRIASLRKWFAIPTGGYIVKHDGELFKKPDVDSEDLVVSKIKAMIEKSKYLQGANISKESYLIKYKEFEQNLSNLSIYYKIDSLSLKTIKNTDAKKVRYRRRRNAKVLYEGLSKLNFVKPLIPSPDFQRCCPFYVPIIVTDGKRDELHKHLINNNVYCPIHWIKTQGVKLPIEDKEISLICDQRYSDNDMRYIIELIKKWCESQYY